MDCLFPKLIHARQDGLRKLPESLPRQTGSMRLCWPCLANCCNPPQSESKSQTLETLSQLVGARRALVKDRTAAKNRQHNLQSALLKRQTSRRLKQIKSDIAALDAACRELVSEDEQLDHRFNILVSMPGIGELTAIIMLVEMPELGAMDKRQTAALAGLAPIARQSGTWKGKSFIRGGRSNLRQALYMPALVAIRFNEEMATKYKTMIEKGKPAKVAITAIMRKLITTANALLRDDRNWTKNTGQIKGLINTDTLGRK